MSDDLELLHSLTEADIEPWFDPAYLVAARRFYRAGHVHSPVRQGRVLAAEVKGEDGLFYDVAILAADDVIRAVCDCDSTSFCEHIGAVLLNWIRAPRDFVSDDQGSRSDVPDFIQELIAQVEDEQLSETGDQSLAFGQVPMSAGDAEALAARVEQAIEQELGELLRQQTVKQLRAIAHRRGWKLRGTRKEELVDQLLRLYFDAQDTADIVATLDDDRRLAIEFLALRARVMPVLDNVFKKTMRNLRKNRSARQATAILQDLQELGLVFATESYAGGAYRMSAAVTRQLPPWPDLLTPFSNEPAKLDVRQSPAFALTQVVYQVWQYLRESPTPKKARALRKPTQLEQRWPSLQGWLNPSDELSELERMGHRFWHTAWQQAISVQFLPPALPEADLVELRQRTATTVDILDFVFSLLTAAGLIAWEYGSDIHIDSDRMNAFLSLSDTRRLGILTSAWMSMAWWTEMALALGHLKHLRLRRGLAIGDFTYGALLQELAQARMIVVALLRRLLPDTWYGMADFRRLLYRLWPGFLHTSSSPSPDRWWLDTIGSDYRLSPDKVADWEVGYAPFVMACLEGPLAWLGMVKLGYDRQSLAAFQIADLGAYLLGLRKSYSQPAQEPAGPALTVHGDGTVLARTGHAATGAYDVLNVVGKLEETSAQEFRYRVTADTAQRAFDHGWTGQAILDELEKHGQDPVPEPLRGHLLTWAEGYGKVHLYDEVTLVEFADDFALQELLASTSLAQHLVYRFSPRLVAIRTEAVDALRDDLVRQGHTPRIE